MQAIALVKEKVDAKAAVKAIAITISFAVLYALMTYYSPVFAKSSFAGMVFGQTLRFANMLRAFSIVTPFAPIGTYFGSVILNSGNPFAGVSFHHIFNPLVGVGIFHLSKIIGRSTLKDLTLLAIYGFLSGVAVTISQAGVAAFFLDEDFWAIIQSLLAFKVFSSMIIYMAGYCLLRPYELIFRKGGEK